MGLCKSSDSWGKVFFCIPLAVFTMLYALGLIAVGIYWSFLLIPKWLPTCVENYEDGLLNDSITDDTSSAETYCGWSWTDLSTAIVTFMSLGAGILGVIAVLCRWGGGLAMARSVFKLVSMIFGVDFFVKIITIIVRLTNDSEEDDYLTPEYIILGVDAGVLVLAYVILSTLKSLKAVYRAGGSGFGFHNAEYYEQERVRARQNDE